MTAVGLALPQLGPHVSPDVVQAFASRAEQLGFASLWVQDHFAYPLEPEGGYVGIEGEPIPAAYRQILSPLELLSVVAGWTSTVRLGTSVLVAGHHRPAPLAKQLATLDVLSKGRLSVGLGIGWCREEHRMCDVDPATRGARMDDFVPALLRCWEPGPVSYEGAYFQIPPSELLPRPVQRPRPPLLAGMWSRAGRRRTATWFDGWNPAGLPVARVLEMAARLAELRDPGLPPLSIHARVFVADPRSSSGAASLGIDGVTREVVQASAGGIDEVIIDASFWAEVARPEDWVALPERLAPCLEAAASAAVGPGRAQPGPVHPQQPRPGATGAGGPAA